MTLWVINQEHYVNPDVWINYQHSVFPFFFFFLPEVVTNEKRQIFPRLIMYKFTVRLQTGTQEGNVNR